MAKNQSPFTVHVTDKDGNSVGVAPGKDFPAGVKIDNPYVTGEKVDESVVPFETGDEDDDTPAPKSEPARKTGSRSSQS